MRSDVIRVMIRVLEVGSTFECLQAFLLTAGGERRRNFGGRPGVQRCRFFSTPFDGSDARRRRGSNARARRDRARVG